MDMMETFSAGSSFSTLPRIKLLEKQWILWDMDTFYHLNTSTKYCLSRDIYLSQKNKLFRGFGSDTTTTIRRHLTHWLQIGTVACKNVRLHSDTMELNNTSITLLKCFFPLCMSHSRHLLSWILSINKTCCLAHNTCYFGDPPTIDNTFKKATVIVSQIIVKNTFEKLESVIKFFTTWVLFSYIMSVHDIWSLYSPSNIELNQEIDL